ncbi:MAG: hypothetical protein ACE10C_00880 [Candidatus Binatia bacterium]
MQLRLVALVIVLGLMSVTPVLGGDTVIFTGTATVEQSCDSTFQVTSGFTLTVNLDNSILPLDTSGDSGFGQYDGLVQSWSFSWDDPALSFWSGTFKGTGEVNITNDQGGRDRWQVRGKAAGLTNFTVTLLDGDATIYSDDSLRLIPPDLSEIEENVLQGIFESDNTMFRIMSGLNPLLADKLLLSPNQELSPCSALDF